MNQFVSLNELDSRQKDQYWLAISKAFPYLLSQSKVIKTNWSILEKYYPEFQQFLITSDGEIIGFINSIPFRFDKALNELPDTGWDWLLQKGISDFDENIKPNLLGGLQVIVRHKYQRLGYSKQIINHAKQLYVKLNLSNLVIPIRPTKKHIYPTLSMQDYLKLKNQDEFFDPWVRTHVNSGAQIIKICEQSMRVGGDIKFWNNILNQNLKKSGQYILKEALHPITIDMDNNKGEYLESNVWIKYG